MYKFFGEPLKEIKSKKTGKIMFRFDTKGEFITDDNEIIQRALGFFDHIQLRSEPEGERVKKTVNTPVMTITKNSDKEEDIKLKHCKKCDFVCENQGELLAHYRDKHPKEG